VSSFCRKTVPTEVQYSEAVRLHDLDGPGPRSASFINATCEVNDEQIACLECEHGSNSIFLSEQQLLQLSVFVGDWVCVVVRDSVTRTTVLNYRLVRAYLLPDSCARRRSRKDLVFICSILGFHLKGRHFIGHDCPRDIEIIALPPVHGLCTSLPVTTGGGDVKDTKLTFNLAKKCVLARVKSPGSSATVDYSKHLEEYFSQPAVVTLNDIIQLFVENDCTGRREAVCFQVVELEETFTTGALVNVLYGKERFDISQTMVLDCSGGRTSLVLEGAVQSHVPPRKLPAGHVHFSISEGNNLGVLKASLLDTFLPQAHANDSKVSIPSPSVLILGGRGLGKRRLVQSIGNCFGMHVMEVNCRRDAVTSDVGGKRLRKNLRRIFAEAQECAPCVLHLRRFVAVAPTNGQTKDEDSLAKFVNLLNDELKKLQIIGLAPGVFPVLFIASSDSGDDVEGAARKCFSHEFTVEPPTANERLAILTSALMSVEVGADVSIESLVKRTAGRSFAELHALVADAGKHAMSRTLQATSISQKKTWIFQRPACQGQNCSITLERCIGQKDFEDALNSMNPEGNSPGASASIPNVKWSDVGGLGQAKEEVMDMITLPLKHPEFFVSGMRQRSGVLFYGPPGTGKTLLAKAIATEFSCNFISVKGPELLNMYIGESERNVRQVFERARAAKPCVLFFDEIDSLAPSRGKGSDGGGVMDRVVSQLLTEIDGLSGSGGGDLFVIGATNRPDLLDSSLLRPGRFDRLLYLGIAEDHEAQLKILQALVRKFRLDDDVNLSDIVKTCPTNYTGADFYALASNALSIALKRRANEISEYVELSQKESLYYESPTTLTKYLQSLTDKELHVYVSMSDFMKAREGIVASVSEEEHNKYKRLRDEYSPSNTNV
jgi:SpoVK/Ycf46/Vps4 family AAA+-type ATPase